MDDTQLYQSPEKSYFKSIIKPVLLVVLGIIVGAGIISVFLFLELKQEEGISEKTQIEITENFENDIADSFPALFEETPEIDIYMMEKGEGIIGVFAMINLSDEQFEKIFGINPKELSSEELEALKGLIIIAQAQYENKKGDWVLKEKPKIYQGMDLELVQESLGTAREKARDAGIKANLSMMRAAAEIWAMDHGDSYDGFCAGIDAQRAMAEIAENEKTALCDDTATTWAAFSPLYDTTAQCFCVDYSGTLKALNAPCPKTAVTVCPK